VNGIGRAQDHPLFTVTVTDRPLWAGFCLSLVGLKFQEADIVCQLGSRLLQLL